MVCRIIFCVSVSLAILIVILLAVLSPKTQLEQSNESSSPWFALSLYMQQPQLPSSNTRPVPSSSDAGALIFRRTLTERPENTSRVVGRAQGFIIPVQHFAQSDFSIIYLTFDTPQYSGSLSVQANHYKEELTVVGGTGSFAFARGVAVFAHAHQEPAVDSVDTTYHVKLQLRFPNRSRTIPG